MSPTWLRPSRQFEISHDEYDREDPGHPLGHGMPMGRTLRSDGDTHGEAWMRVLRADPCAYCGARKDYEEMSVDHVVPQTKRIPGEIHTWRNWVGACQRCNGAKRSHDLLDFLFRRAHGMSLERAAGKPAKILRAEPELASVIASSEIGSSPTRQAA